MIDRLRTTRIIGTACSLAPKRLVGDKIVRNESKGRISEGSDSVIKK